MNAVCETKAEPTQTAHQAAVEYIDMAPTWGEWGLLYRRFAEQADPKLKDLRPDFDKAMASCQALKALAGTLTDEQMALVARVMANELAKLRQ
jgi:hypothetical protein